MPRYSHGEVIEAVFRRTRVTVAIMTSAKLLSAVEPVIRYARGRFRGGSIATPGSPRYELGLQLKQDVVHRLVDVWAMGEASASLGFEAARVFDLLDPLEKQKSAILAERGIAGGIKTVKYMRQVQKDAIEFLHGHKPELADDVLVQCALLDSVANVLCPACKLWNTGQGAQVMREAVSLMGGYGITEDCPGFLGHKWMDSQLEATYEGPEAVQRRQLSITMTDELFLTQFRQWIRDMRIIANDRPGTGACALATAMQMWLWTLEHLLKTPDADGAKLYHSPRQGVTFPLADALGWLLSARSQILDVLELEKKGPENPTVAEGLPGLLAFLTDLCHVQSARAAGEVGRICAELVFGYNRHPAWDTEGCASCYQADGLEAMESPDPRHLQHGARVHGRDRSRWLASRQGGAVRPLRQPRSVHPAAGAHGRLPDRFAASQRPGRRCPHEGHDSRGAGLPGMSESAADRQTMEVDIACVGFGPATAGFLATLSKRLVNEDGTPAVESPSNPGLPLQVVCYERADDIGFGVSGVVTRARGIRATLPDLDPTRIPMAAAVRHEKVVYLLDPVGASRRSPVLRMGDRALRLLGLPKEHGYELPYVPPFLHKHGGMVLSLGQFMQFLGSELMGSGAVQIWPGSPVSEALVERGRVCGVRLCDQGVDREGVPEAGFMPGMDVRAALTVIGDGPVGAVGRQLDEEFGLPEATISVSGPLA